MISMESAPYNSIIEYWVLEIIYFLQIIAKKNIAISMIGY